MKTLLIMLFMVYSTGLWANTVPRISTDSLIYQDGIDPYELEEIIRTSDMKAKKAPSNMALKRAEKEMPGTRIGSICIDGEYSETTGTGSCSSHKGVRFWIYQKGTEAFLLPTKRHYADIGGYQPTGDAAAAEETGEILFFFKPNATFYVVLVVLIFSLTVYFIIRKIREG